jgi:hormone-sensitive lipase
VAISRKFFVPSLVRSYTDIILNFRFLEFCLWAYTNDEIYENENPFISPILANEEVLRRYPPTKIYCGEDDPMYDYSLYMAHVLHTYDVPVKLISIMNVAHGFMALYMPLGQGLQEIRNLVSLISDHMSEKISHPTPPDSSQRKEEPTKEV